MVTIGGGLLTINSKNINTRESRRTIICMNIKKYLKNWCVLRNKSKIEGRIVIQRKKYCS